MLFQFLPRLSDDEYATLEASIREHGVQVPVVLDENGSVIDGHHRKEIADRIGVDFPKRTKIGLTDTQKRTLALSLNLDRRHLTREDRRRLIQKSIAADPELTDREHARRVQVSPSTVGAVRADMERSGEVSKLDTRVDPRGYSQPASRPETTKAGDDLTVDLSTGEVIDEHPAVAPKPIVGLDGKQYTRPEPKPITVGPDADTLNARTESQAIGRSLMNLSALRNDAHRNRIITQWWPAGNDSVPPDSRALFEPKAIRDIATWLMQLADDLEVAP